MIVMFCFLQMLYFKQIDIFLYNLGNYSLGKIGYHFLMLLPMTILIKPINYIKTDFTNLELYKEAIGNLESIELDESGELIESSRLPNQTKENLLFKNALDWLDLPYNHFK